MVCTLSSVLPADSRDGFPPVIVLSYCGPFCRRVVLLGSPLWGGFAFVSAEELMNSMGPNKFVGFFLDWGSHNGLVKIWV